MAQIDKQFYYKESDLDYHLSQAEIQVLGTKRAYQEYWRDKDDSYWLQRLIQEIGECASVLASDHNDALEHELTQIASIALNWLEKIGFKE